eukprot:gene2321-500_t
MLTNAAVRPVLQKMKEKLEEIGAEVVEPFANAEQLAFVKEPAWAYKSAQRDLQDVRECDGIFAVVNGVPPDEALQPHPPSAAWPRQPPSPASPAGLATFPRSVSAAGLMPWPCYTQGVMVELGYAMALKKEVFLFRDDFRHAPHIHADVHVPPGLLLGRHADTMPMLRKVNDTEEYPLNLMVFAAHPPDSWRDWYYSSYDELADPSKALAKWLKE